MKIKYKIERWLTDVFPGPSKIYEAYRHLSGRELVIVSSAVIDIALANLISLRCSESDEVHSFLGVDGNGRAPAGTLGSRIQLALILGIIDDYDAAVLRIHKDLRNKMAHRVRANWLEKDVQITLDNLLRAWEAQIKRIYPEKDHSYLKTLRIGIKTRPLACDALIHSVLTMHQAYFHRISDSIQPLGPAIIHRNRQFNESHL